MCLGPQLLKIYYKIGFLSEGSEIDVAGSIRISRLHKEKKIYI